MSDMPTDSYYGWCRVCDAVTVWALLLRVGRRSTWRCTACGRLREWRAR